MKSVLISIQPYWCYLIASGEKTLEVRKTRPKMETPFKCYIYCTLSGSNEFFKDTLNGDVAEWNCGKWGERKSNVIGEFVCSGIFPISVEYSDPNSLVALNKFPSTGLTDKQIIDYLGNGVTGYAWHISDLKIYDKPKELSEFIGIKTFRNGFEVRLLERPPQSWCYVMED